MSDTAPTDGTEVPHPSYYPTGRACVDTQRTVARRWADGAWPTSTDGTVYSSENFRGIQRDDGSGVLRHYRTREAIRLADGTVIDNQQCWAEGLAHCTRPPDVDATLPLDAVEELTDHGHRAFDIVDVLGGNARPQNTVAVFDGDGGGEGGPYGIAVGIDPSALSRDSRYFVFRVDAEAVEFARAHGVDAMMDRELTPAPVREHSMDVVHSADYAETHLEEHEARDHVEAGGRIHECEGRGRTQYCNYQSYRADLRGAVIVRHGEFFFVPDSSIDDEDVKGADGVIEPLGSHVVKDADAQGYVEDDGGRTIVVRRRIGHRTNDHHQIHLGDTWHRVHENGVDAMTYDPNPTPSNGGRGGRFD